MRRHKDNQDQNNLIVKDQPKRHAYSFLNKVNLRQCVGLVGPHKGQDLVDVRYGSASLEIDQVPDGEEHAQVGEEDECTQHEDDELVVDFCVVHP